MKNIFFVAFAIVSLTFISCKKETVIKQDDTIGLVKIQEIIANKSFEKKEFKLIDCNFDGYKDISVLYNCGSGGCAYWIWNYSAEKKLIKIVLYSQLHI